MSLRHNLFLFLAGACALALLGPLLLHHRSASSGSITTAAPPLTAPPGAADPEDPHIAPLRREAGGALDQLRAQSGR